MQVKLYWVVIIMDIFIIYAKYEESSTIFSIYFVHSAFLIVWKKDAFLNTSACLPAKEMVLFLYCVLCFAVVQTTLFVV